MPRAVVAPPAAARQWLRARQRSDGLWPAPPGGDRESTTAFAVWCLGPEDPAVRQISPRRRQQWLQSEDPYLLALGATLAASEPVDAPEPGAESVGQEVLAERLAAAALVEGGGPRGEAVGRTVQGLSGRGSVTECTALAVLALAPQRKHEKLVAAAAASLVGTRQPGGSWGSPLSTALALRALATAGVLSRPTPVAVSVDGKALARAHPALDLRGAAAERAPGAAPGRCGGEAYEPPTGVGMHTALSRTGAIDWLCAPTRWRWGIRVLFTASLGETRRHRCA